MINIFGKFSLDIDNEDINLSLIKEDKENINNQIVLTFANIFNREIKLIKEDILKIKKELLI
ncbi:hypothetical protein [Spiroplasma endosymbiont of Phycita roborella]|uniref:hypothetical protein n=1 Tax=Spiroplasma endosymbiont of Phycita roborella TaxID=3066311 RepID=UPI00313B9D84